jgi:presenilin-like A22 family membrane protease
MARVETILESRQPEEKISRGVALRLDIFEAIREYWHLIALLAAIITCGLSYFFGIKVKD